MNLLPMLLGTWIILVHGTRMETGYVTYSKMWYDRVRLVYNILKNLRYF